MRVQTSSKNSPHFVRRIPRGGGEKSDPISRLERQASAHQKRIRGMKLRVKRDSDRRALEEARQRLIKVLHMIAERPSEVITGTLDIIDSAMAEARTIFASAPKIDSHRRKRPTEEKGVRGKNMPREEDTGSTSSADPRPTDPAADEFDRELDVMYTYR